MVLELKRLQKSYLLNTETIGYARGLWLLWNSDKVEIEELVNTE